MRDELGAKGVVLDVDVLATPMDVLSGGPSTGGNAWGNVDYTLNVDTQKLGLWPGGFAKVWVDTSFGTQRQQFRRHHSDRCGLSGSRAERSSHDAHERDFHAVLVTTELGVLIGKINMLDAAEQEFYGDYRTQFLNTAFNFPMTTAFAPISAFGGGVIALPTRDLHPVGIGNRVEQHAR